MDQKGCTEPHASEVEIMRGTIDHCHDKLEVRLRNTEQGLSQVVDNIDRIESHMLAMANKPKINWVQYGSITIAMIGALATAGLGLMGHMDRNYEYLKNSSGSIERRLETNTESLNNLSSEVSDRLGRVETMTASNNDDVKEIRDELRANHRE